MLDDRRGSQRAKGRDLKIKGHREEQGHDASPVEAEAKAAAEDRMDTHGTRQQADIIGRDIPFNTTPL